MIADSTDNGPCENPVPPFEFVRVVEEDAVVAGIPTVDGVLCCFVGSAACWLVDVTVRNRLKCMFFVDYAFKSIGKAGILHAIQNNSGNCNLSFIRFSLSFGVNEPCQEIDVQIGLLAGPARGDP